MPDRSPATTTGFPLQEVFKNAVSEVGIVLAQTPTGAELQAVDLELIFKSVTVDSASGFVRLFSSTSQKQETVEVRLATRVRRAGA